MNPFPGPHMIGGGLGALGRVATLVLGGLWFLLMAVVIIGLVVLVVRFLLVATKAAQLYVTNNSPAKAPNPPTAPSAPGEPAPAASVAPVEPPPVEPPTEPTIKPRAPRAPRTPKTPPTT